MVNASETSQPYPASTPTPGRPSTRPISFNIQSKGQGVPASAEGSSASLAIQPFPIQVQTSEVPGLAKPKRPIFSRHRHDANPALALKVLQDIHLAIESWHGELKEVLHRIQGIYMEGPIVEGWLETLQPSDQNSTPLKEAALLRHGDPADLSSYVDRLCQSLDQETTTPAAEVSTAPTYRLCSLNAEGQVEWVVCPPEQLSSLSLAIARHQKLRQLLDQKQYLEARLKRAVEVLTAGRNSLDIPATCSSQPETD
ncbi:MAG: hypothetical protein LVS60_05060 [Nodosilinea sp. LVE1205-7]|jgi:hypothetical protein